MPDHPTIYCDDREKASIAKKLDLMGANIIMKRMEVGDYCISDRIGFERKNVEDFRNSLFRDRTLFGQVRDLSNAYERPILIVEGAGIFTSGATPQSIQGALNSICLDFHVPVIYTRTPEETAEILYNTAKKEQFGQKRIIQLHGKRSHLNSDEQKEFVISSVSGIGRATSQKLLNKFGTVESVFIASVDELNQCVNQALAKKIKEVASSKYGVE